VSYARIHDRIWHELRALGDDARTLALYARTCTHRSRVGLYRLEPLYIAADLGWEEPRVQAALRELDGAAGVAWDADARVILVTDVVLDDPPANANVATAAVRELESVPDTPLFARLLEAVDEARARAEAAGKVVGHFETLLTAVAKRAGVTRIVPVTVAEPLWERSSEAEDNGDNGSRNGRSPVQLQSSSSSKPTPTPAPDPGERDVSQAGDAGGNPGDGGPPRDYNAQRAWDELKGVIVDEWHRGSERIRVGRSEVGMQAEQMNVVQLVERYGVDDVVAAVRIAPTVFADDWDGPTSLRWFTSKEHGRANFNRALEESRRRPGLAPRHAFPAPTVSRVAAVVAR
jgi:hypothetical protein